MNHKPGSEVPETGVYWCTVCRSPQRFEKGQKFPACKNLCPKGYWQLVNLPPKG
mgnify:CR=1 FL=1